MKRIILIFLTSIFGQLNGQGDSIPSIYRNGISYEVVGITPLGFNLNYHRFQSFTNYPNVLIGMRGGFSVTKSSFQRPVLGLPFDISIMFGSKRCRLEIGTGYLGLFGKNQITVFDHWELGPAGDLAITKEVTYYYYDYYFARIGISIMPQNTRSIFAKILWSPYYIPLRNDIPYSSIQSEPQNPKRTVLLNAGITIGVVF